MSTINPFIRDRIYILSENENQINAESVVKIKRTSNGQETITDIPLHVLQEPNSTLHQFAAGALLRDLSSKQSWIQRDNHTPADSSEEKELTREGERLGCKYSLLSQWTSFVAVENSKDDSEPLEKSEYTTEIRNRDKDLQELVIHYSQLQGAVHIVDGPIDSSPYALRTFHNTHGISVPFPVALWRVAKAGWTLSNQYLMGFKTKLQSQTDLEESFIRRVLKSQKSAGVFYVPKKDAPKFLGAEVHGIVKELHDKGVPWDLAVTAAIVVWLEVKYPEERMLWVRMVEKARDYIQPHLGRLGNGEKSMLNVAEQMARDAKDPRKESDNNKEQ